MTVEMWQLWLAWAAGALALAAGGGPAEDDEEEVWQGFLEWLPRAQNAEHPGTFIQEYLGHLQACGAAEPEAKRRVGVILRLMRTRTDGWQQIFNNIYSRDRAGFTTQPNGLLASAVERVKPGKALDAGMGQGRNSVFLALKGWDVTGFDLSEAGVSAAKKNAAAAGVELTALQGSGADFEYGTRQWDLIVFTYGPFPVTDTGYMRKLRESLRPGGLLVVESFASEASARNRRPVDIDPAELKAALHEFRILRFEEVEAIPDWTMEKARLVRAVAQLTEG